MIFKTLAEKAIYMARRHLCRMWELIAQGMMALAYKHHSAAIRLMS